MESFLAWLIESSLLILIIFGIRKIFAGKIPYAGIYALWLVVLLRFLIPVNFISAPVSVSDLVIDTFSARETESVDGLTEGVYTGVESSQLYRDNMAFTPAQSIVENKGESDPQSHLQTEISGQTVSFGESKEMAAPHSSGREKMEIDWFRILKRGWGAVSGLLLLWILLSNIRLFLTVRKNRVLYSWKESVPVYTTESMQSPCLYGFLRPAIYLPAALVLSEQKNFAGREELEQIITHEYVHYQHRDSIWAFFRILLVSVYWYNPLVWMAASASQKDAELFCDEKVIRLLGEENRFGYGKMLVRMAGNHSWGDFRYSMMPVSRKGKEMERRIRAIAIKRKYSKRLLVPLAVLLFAAICITGNAGFRPLAKESGSESTKKDNPAVSGPAVNGEVSDDIEMAPLMTGNILAGNNTFAGGQKFSSWWAKSFGDAWENQIISGAPEEIYKKYLTLFTEAVNTGETDEMDQVLAADSDIYRQQCSLVKNYYKRGIREELKTYSVSWKQLIDTDTVAVSSKEEIAVFYADGTSRLVKQKYRYICQYIGGVWRITGMEEW